MQPQRGHLPPERCRASCVVDRLEPVKQLACLRQRHLGRRIQPAQPSRIDRAPARELERERREVGLVPTAASVRVGNLAFPLARSRARQRVRHGFCEELACFGGQKCGEVGAKQHLTPLAEKPAIRLVDECQRRVGCESAHQFGLGVDHRAITLFALSQCCFLLASIGDVDGRPMNPMKSPLSS